MEYNDYYQVLNIKYTSSDDNIKKSFRKLALQFHPDITNNDVLKTEKFNIIKTAYAILSDPDKRKAYHSKHLIFNKNIQLHTIISFEKYINGLNKRYSFQHPEKVNYDEIIAELNECINLLIINDLIQASDLIKNKEVLKSLYSIVFLLPYKFMKPFSLKLLQLSNGDKALERLFLKELETKKKEMRWNRYKIPLVIAAAIFVCLGIAALAKL